MDDTAKDQEEVLGFLADPATYGDKAKKVRRIDTHAASVFLAGDRVLKIKRAVRFPFLDYSTLAKRKAACAAEIEVNRRLAPELYRGVVAITRETHGRLAIGGDGEPVEWAVDMVRFDENRTLDHLTNEIDDDLADALGRAVAAAHTSRRRSSTPNRGSKRSATTSTSTSRRLPSTRTFFRPRMPTRSPQKAASTTNASCRSCASAAGAGWFAAFTAIFTSATSR